MTTYPSDQGNPAGAIPVYIAGPGGISGAPLGFQSVAITDAEAIGLPDMPAGTVYAIVTLSQAGLYRDDGTPPTPTVGTGMVAGTPYTFSGPQLETIQFITAANDGLLNVSYYGQ